MGELLWCKGSKLKIAFWKQLLQKFWQISKQKSVAKAFLSKIVGVTPAILLIVGFVIFNSRRLFQQQLSLQYIWTATVLVNRPLSTLKSIQVIIYEFFNCCENMRILLLVELLICSCSLVWIWFNTEVLFNIIDQF